MFHDRWTGLWQPSLAGWEVIVRATVAYLFVQFIFRVVGRKELGRYSTFDIAVLFLIATAMRRTIVAEDSSLTTGMLALTVIVGLDWLFSWLSFRSERAANVLQGPVVMLVEDGKPDERNLRRARISRRELDGYIRERGIAGIEDVAAAYLERSGRISVIRRRRQ